MSGEEARFTIAVRAPLAKQTKSHSGLKRFEARTLPSAMNTVNLLLRSCHLEENIDVTDIWTGEIVWPVDETKEEDKEIVKQY